MSSTELPDLLWRKSSHSNGQANCVEATTTGNGQTGVCVRDSRAPDAARLAFTARVWRQFTESIRSRGFHAGLPHDLSGSLRQENREGAANLVAFLDQ
jgi:hypothetical protein